MALIWRVKIRSSPPGFDQAVALAAQVIISLILASGLAYLVMAVRVFIEFSKNSRFRVGPASNLNLHHGRQDMTKLSTGIYQYGHGQDTPPNHHPLRLTPSASIVENPSKVANRQDLTEEDPPREWTRHERGLANHQATNSPVSMIDIELRNRSDT
ncbi:hypothetical protein EST38_g382 [Candolleomyces aberdarensis]|uniref:Uncharacterized protein n=1 Tax=Candolleomyces aberdarensis TaxID=2316362 RepID=A0A4Q2E0P1_9AGAR|nr:hypothetical protein EST38_g382 [Candolleomyces aberdarensis]